uniref:CX domain-containing protein n=1 Tax=Panagrellus redivivus TaxID=6233 RepID=A0A7E4USS4_PANRE
MSGFFTTPVMSKYVSSLGLKTTLRSVTLIVVLVSLCQSGSALTCYDNTSGEMELVTNDAWEVCTLVPDVPINQNMGSKVYGLGQQNDNLDPYLSAFKNNDEKYQVLSMCIYERYDFRSFSPKFTQPEVLFRCVCNYDRCNSALNFEYYLSNLAEKPAVPPPVKAGATPSAAASSKF